MSEALKTKPINDIRTYIDALDTHGLLHRVKAEVDSKYELAHISKVNEEKKGPAMLYENVKGHTIPVFTSAFTTPERIAICLEQDPSLTMCQLSRKWMELTTKQMIKPTFVDNPPVMENIIEKDDVDLDNFPAPWFYPDDGGRFFGTSGYLVTQDPDTGWTNCGTYRSQVLGKNILGSAFEFVVHVHRGAGAFVCGESTALMTALEGRVGEPESIQYGWMNYRLLD